MRDFINIVLGESVQRLMINYQPVVVYRNPTMKALQGFLNEWPGGVRGLTLDRDTWVWNSMEAVHFQVIAALGLGPGCGEFLIRGHDEEPGAWEAYYELTVFKGAVTAAPTIARALERLDRRVVITGIDPAPINEAVEMVSMGRYDLKVLRNPSKDALRDLFLSAYQGLVRFIINGRDIFFWDAQEAIHAELAPQLGIDLSKMTAMSHDPITGVMKRSPTGMYDVGHLNSLGVSDSLMTYEQWEILEFNPVWERYTMGFNPRPEHGYLGW